MNDLATMWDAQQPKSRPLTSTELAAIILNYDEVRQMGHLFVMNRNLHLRGCGYSPQELKRMADEHATTIAIKLAPLLIKCTPLLSLEAVL